MKDNMINICYDYNSKLMSEIGNQRVPNLKKFQKYFIEKILEVIRPDLCSNMQLVNNKNVIFSFNKKWYRHSFSVADKKMSYKKWAIFSKTFLLKLNLYFPFVSENLSSTLPRWFTNSGFFAFKKRSINNKKFHIYYVVQEKNESGQRIFYLSIKHGDEVFFSTTFDNGGLIFDFSISNLDLFEKFYDSIIIYFGDGINFYISSSDYIDFKVLCSNLIARVKFINERSSKFLS